MRLAALMLVSACIFTPQACAAASIPLDIEALLFKLLPEPAVAGGGGGGVFIRKQGHVDCVVRNTAPPGGPASTTVNCNVAGTAATLREHEARKLFDFLKVEARPTRSDGLDMRKEALVECVRTAIAPPGGPVVTGTTCTAK